MSGCETCDRQGPLEPTLLGAGVELHRAMHDLARAMLTVEFVSVFATLGLAASVAAFLWEWRP